MPGDRHEEHRGHYARLGLMGVLHLVAMYVLMYAMVDRAGNVLPNANQLYMAALMTAPMLALEPLIMRAMYPDRRLNGLVWGISAVLLVGPFLLLREQVAVGDAQFLRSMIPHHAGAILMCEEAPLRDADIRELCDGIVEGQQAEIDWMKEKLASLRDRR